MRIAGCVPFFAILLTGCLRAPPPEIVPVEGIVLLDGEPLKNVEVRFIPTIEHGPEHMAKGVTDDAGRFVLTCKGGPGAFAGENLVVVAEAPLPRHVRGESHQLELAKYLKELGGRPLPPRYTNLADNPLVVIVTADRKDYTLQLTR